MGQLKFARNKLVSIRREGKDRFVIHGILDDDIYSLEIRLAITISGLEILHIEGKWNRWTTPECPRAVSFLQDAVGLQIESEDFSQQVQRLISRKACRHYANLLLECCHSAKEAALLVKWEETKVAHEELSLGSFVQKSRSAKPRAAEVERHAPKKRPPSRDPQTPSRVIESGTPAGFFIDLHVHSAPASPCSSAPVDDLIQEAKRIGLDGICLTDHNYVWDDKRIEELRRKHQFVVLRGNEVTTDQGDMVVFGLDKDIKGIIKLAELNEEVSKAGGFIIIAHPFRGFLTFNVGQLGLTPEKAMARPLFRWVHAVEVLNSKVTEKENAFASEVAMGLALPRTGGSDAHEVCEVGIYATRFEQKIDCEKDLVQALKRRRYAPVTFRKEKG